MSVTIISNFQKQYLKKILASQWRMLSRHAVWLARHSSRPWQLWRRCCNSSIRDQYRASCSAVPVSSIGPLMVAWWWVFYASVVVTMATFLRMVVSVVDSRCSSRSIHPCCFHSWCCCSRKLHDPRWWNWCIVWTCLTNDGSIRRPLLLFHSYALYSSCTHLSFFSPKGISNNDDVWTPIGLSIQSLTRSC